MRDPYKSSVLTISSLPVLSRMHNRSVQIFYERQWLKKRARRSCAFLTVYSRCGPLREQTFPHPCSILPAIPSSGPDQPRSHFQYIQPQALYIRCQAAHKRVSQCIFARTSSPSFFNHVMSSTIVFAQNARSFPLMMRESAILILPFSRMLSEAAPIISSRVPFSMSQCISASR